MGRLIGLGNLFGLNWERGASYGGIDASTVTAFGYNTYYWKGVPFFKPVPSTLMKYDGLFDVKGRFKNGLTTVSRKF